MSEQPQKTPIPGGVVARVANGMRGFVEGVTGATWFGPLEPIQPIAPPMPPRLFDYPFGVNLQTQPRAYEGASFSQMRALADSYDLLRLVIETRKDQVVKIPWAIRVQPEPGETRQAMAARAAKSADVKRITALLERPDGESDWQTWLRMVLEDMFVTDSVSIVPVRSRGGDVIRLDVIDGSTIKRVIDADGRTPEPPSIAYQQVLHGMPAVNLTADDLVYRPRNRRAHKAYGYSPVEQVIVAGNLAIRRQIFQLGYYTEGNIPEAIVQVPESWTPDQIRQFQSWFDSALAGNMAARRRMTFIPPTGHIEYPKSGALKDEMDEWLARVVCFAFSIPPTAFSRQMNRATAETAQESALSEGLLPILNWLQSALMNYIIHRVIGAPGVSFEFQDDLSVDPEEQAKIEDIRIKNGSLSVDEARIARGLDPIGAGHAVYTGTGPVPIGEAEQEQDEGDADDDAAAKLAKGTVLKADPAALTPAKANAENAARKAVAAFLAAIAPKIAESAESAYSKLGKADGDADLDSVMAAVDVGDWGALADLLSGPISAAAKAAGLAALAQIGASDQAMFDQVNDAAAEFAKARGAELIGMKRSDGGLVVNPDARWAITDSTRDGIRKLVAQALTDGMTPQQLKTAVQESSLFSPQRARMVARTEIATAHVQGTISGWKASRVVGGKSSMLGSEHENDDDCNLNADAGVIGLDDTFPSGDDGPPYHANCVCVLLAEQIEGVDE